MPEEAEEVHVLVNVVLPSSFYVGALPRQLKCGGLGPCYGGLIRPCLRQGKNPEQRFLFSEAFAVALPESQLPASPCFGERLVKQEQPNPNKRTSTQQAPQAPKPRLECVSRNPHPTREATKPHIQL